MVSQWLLYQSQFKLNLTGTTNWNRALQFYYMFKYENHFKESEEDKEDEDDNNDGDDECDEPIDDNDSV